VSYYAAINGQQQGPFELTILRGRVAAGEITRDTLVWKQSMPNWTPAGQVDELKPLFESLPPPLPPV
jgi:hypothetical protein